MVDELKLTRVVNKKGSSSLPGDVKSLQGALNKVDKELGGPISDLDENGVLNGSTTAAIVRFQRMNFRDAGFKEFHGEVHPNGATVGALRQILTKKKLGDFNIWLANPGRLTFTWQELCEEVARVFKPVRKRTNYQRFVVRSTMSRLAASGSTDILIYILATRNQSVLAEHFGIPVPQSGKTGWTHWVGQGPAASEVYLANPGDPYKVQGMYTRSPTNVALSVYHEAMHNVLREDDGMHSRGGLAVADGMDESNRRQNNDKDMARAIENGVSPQWTGGWDAFDRRKAAQKKGKIKLQTSGDPLSGL